MKEQTTPDVYCTFQEASEHKFAGHPESPQRTTSMGAWIDSPPYPNMKWLPYEPAKESDVVLVHHHGMLSELRAESQRGPHIVEHAPTYVTESSFQDSLGAVGATLAVSRRIIAEGEGFGFAIVRPPGHHADQKTAMGFCLLNNIAIAVSDAIASGLKKAVIIDFDAHHGNGTQNIFKATPEVSYLSLHERGIYPGTGGLESASHTHGRIINIPLPAFAGNKAFLRVIDEIVEPWIANFQPEMVFVSAGFDAHFSDPLTSLTLDTKGFYAITSRLVKISERYAGGRLMFVLEGGYDPIALKDNVQACLAAMCSQTAFPDHYGKAPGVNPEIDSLIEKLHKYIQIKEN